MTTRHPVAATVAWGAACLAGGALLGLLRVPAAWLLGPMLASMAVRIVLAPPERSRQSGAILGQWIIGSVLGARFSLEALQSGLVHLGPLLVLVLFTAGLCLVNARLLRRWAGVDKSTAFLGTLPGAASAIVALSAELDVDGMMVTMLMYVRVVLILVLTPLALSLVFPSALVSAPGASPAATASVPALASGLTVLLAVVAARAARLAHMPSPNFMGPFVLIMVLRISFSQLPLGLPPPLFRLGLVLLGGSVGLQVDPARMRQAVRPVLVQAGLVLALLAACVLAGYLFHLATGVDLLTAVLGTTPGGKEAMIATSIELGGNVEMVMAMQTFRWLLILTAGPSLAAWMSGRATRMRRRGAHAPTGEGP